ncbi:MAG: hypothetical protein HUU20_00555 [Pirellulales bacterium]|nr:hypothetical protein [Pirellulales bacterium]
MKDVPENELFSAYLDGELTVDEQAEVEELLAASPPAHQLLDELRALSATLQSLPARKIGVDLGDAVLRTAERRMLAEAPSRHRDGGRNPVRSGWRQVFQRITRPRVILWSGLAVGVALMLTFTTPKSDQRNEVARHSTEVSPAGQPNAEIRSVEPRQPETAIAAHEAEKSGSGPGEPSPPSEPEPAKVPLGDMPTVAATDRPASLPAAPESPAPSDSRAPQPAPLIVAAPPADQPAVEPAAAPGPSDHPAKPPLEPQAGSPSVLLVRCDGRTDRAQEQLSKILAEQQIAFQARTVPAPAASSGKTVVFVADAPPSQVEAAVAKLKGQPEAFSSVSLETLTSDAAKTWTGGPLSEAVVIQSHRAASQGTAESSTLAVQGPDGAGTVSTGRGGASGTIRFRIGASTTVRKAKPGVKPKVHFDPAPQPPEATNAEKPAPEQAQTGGSGKAGPTPLIGPAERHRVVFVLSVKDATPPDAPQ